MTYEEAVSDLQRKTVWQGFSPFCTIQRFPANQVPCHKVSVNQATYILFVDKTGHLCCWRWDCGDPELISMDELPTEAKESDRWFGDTWYTNDSPYNVADWYQEEGWPVHGS